MLKLDCLTVTANIGVRDPSSVYVVYQPPQILDGCGNWVGGLYGDALTSVYRSDFLHTLQVKSDGLLATKTLNFADLPCPPTEVAALFDTGAPYLPILLPPKREASKYKSISNDHYATTESCNLAPTIDPPVQLHSVDHVSGPKEGKGGIPR